MKKISKKQAKKDYDTLLAYVTQCLFGIISYNQCSEIASYIYDTLNEES